MFCDILLIEDFVGNLFLEFIDYDFGELKYLVEEFKNCDVNYVVLLCVKLCLINKEIGEVKD